MRWKRCWPRAATNLATAERERDEAQSRIQGAHREHADLLGQLEGERARSQESTLRRERLEEEAAEVTREVGLGQDTLARARAELDRGLVALDALDSRRAGLEDEREERREAVQAARARSQAAQLASRDLLIRIESRRSSETSMSVGLKRMADQRAQTQIRSTELEAALADGDLPIVELEGKLKDFLARRLEVEVGARDRAARARRSRQRVARARREAPGCRDARQCSARGDGTGAPATRRNRACVAKASSSSSPPRASTSPKSSRASPPMRRCRPGKSR